MSINDWNTIFLIFRVANLARSDENAGKRC